MQVKVQENSVIKDTGKMSDFSLHFGNQGGVGF